MFLATQGIAPGKPTKAPQGWPKRRDFLRNGGQSVDNADFTVCYIRCVYRAELIVTLNSYSSPSSVSHFYVGSMFDNIYASV